MASSASSDSVGIGVVVVPSSKAGRKKARDGESPNFLDEASTRVGAFSYGGRPGNNQGDELLNGSSGSDLSNQDRTTIYDDPENGRTQWLSVQHPPSSMPGNEMPPTLEVQAKLVDDAEEQLRILHQLAELIPRAEEVQLSSSTNTNDRQSCIPKVKNILMILFLVMVAIISTAVVAFIVLKREGAEEP